MKQETISSPQNPKVKLVRTLTGRPKERREQQAFVAEGVRLVEEALASGHRCSAVFDGERLANYGWYGPPPCRVNRTFRVAFRGPWLYKHHGFTAPEYRGRRLHALGIQASMRELRAEVPDRPGQH